MEFTTTQQRIAAIPRQQPVLKKPVFVAALTIFGVFSALAGIISLANAIVLSSNSMPSLAEAMLIDTVYEFILAALIFASSRAFTKGKLLSVWLYGSSIVLDSLYNAATGYPLNYVFIGFGLLLIWQILRYRDELDLS